MSRIALAQINTTVGDLKGNADKIIAAVKKAKQLSVDIVAFPELALTGYPPEDLLLKKHFVRDSQKALKQLVKETAKTTAIVGVVDKDRRGRLYNAAVVLHDRKVKGFYHKERLPNYGVFDEKRYFQEGANNKIFTLGPLTFGVTVCEDIWSKEGPHRLQAQAGAQILFNLSSSPYHAGKRRERERMLKSCAKTNRAYVCYVNLVGGQDELIFDGGSMIINPKGKIMASAKQFEEDLVVVDIKSGPRRKPRKRLPRVSLSKTVKTEGKLPIKGKKARRLKPIEEIYNALVLGIKDYVSKNGFNKVVLGLSGGIDSSLVAAIACDALGPGNVIGVSMPSRYTSIATRLDARRLAQNLHISFKQVEIAHVHRSYLKVLKEEFAGLKPDIAEENIQARIRGNLLMALSNKFGWLVLTTGNKSETAVGYCTLYGDMAGGFAVIKDIPKTKVYELALYRNALSKEELIPQTVIKRAPTAELRANQKDQDALPSYPTLDAILADYIEHDKSLAKIQKKKISAKVAKKVVRMVDRNEYKRRQSAPGIKITPKAFGRDRRLPITNRYKEGQLF